MLKKLLLLFKRGCLWISLNLISSSNNFTIVQFTTIKMLSDAKKNHFLQMYHKSKYCERGFVFYFEGKAAI